jgi:hypothetical protein
MQTDLKVPESAAQSSTEVHPAAAEVNEALERILSSQPFRTSKQCQALLRYIVNHSLGGDDTGLRERVVGVEVFGRLVDYDTSEDPVVRMRAADVRKRLAQYYQSAEYDGSPVHIELKPGSYRASFRYEPTHKEMSLADSVREPTAVLLPVGDPSSRSSAMPVFEAAARPGQGWGRGWRWRWSVLLAGVLLLFAGVGFFLWRAEVGHAATVQQRFWEPLTRGDRPVLLYLGSNVAYVLRPEFLERYQHEHGLDYNGPEFFPDLPKGGSVRNEDLLQEKNTFVTVGDLAASAQLITLMSGWSKPFLLRSAEDVSMGELRNTPTVLVGGFNNRWTLQTMSDLPFGFRDGRRIQSRTDPAQGWSIPPDRRDGNTEDFALISRVLHSNTGGPVLAIGGVGSFGTQAAAEFVASAEQMNALLRTAPAGWETKNMQAVLRIKVVGYAPVAVEVVATIYW